MDIHRRSGAREVGPDSVGGRVILTRRIVQITDVKEDPEYAVVGPLTLGYRTALGVPLLREGAAIGAIVLWRREVRPFADKQIQLVRTFADQAVIAIENVRLFTELGARNRELTESLEQQTATSEILRAISASPTDTQPVFDTIAQHAFRVCDGSHCTVMQFDGTLIHMVAHHGQSPGALEVYRQAYPLPPDADTMVARSIREGAVVHNPDMLSDPSETVRRISRAGGYRTGVIVPMLRGGKAVGAIGVGRSGPGGTARPYTEKEIALLQTFADQGVIAVENVRLFRELETRTRELARSVEELQALSEVGRAVSSTLDLPTVLATIVARAVQLSGTSGGVIYEYDETAEEFDVRASHRTEAGTGRGAAGVPIRLGEGVSGQAALRQAPVEVADILDYQQYQVDRIRTIFIQLGLPVDPRHPAPSRATDPGRADRLAARGRELSAGDGEPAPDLRDPVRPRDPERAAVPRDRGEGAGAGGGEPAQEPVPGQHEPRAADAAQRGPRLHGAADRRHLRRAVPEGRRCHDPHRPERQAPSRPDQRRPRPVQDRGGPARARARRLRAGGGRARRGHPGRVAGGREGAHPPGGRRAGPARGAGRRAAAGPGAPEPRRQRHQVHGGRLGADRRPPGRRRVRRVRRRQRAGDRRGRPAADLRGVPAGGQLEHAEEGRHRTRALHRPADRRAPRRPDLGRVDGRARVGLQLPGARARRPSGARA